MCLFKCIQSIIKQPEVSRATQGQTTNSKMVDLNEAQLENVKEAFEVFSQTPAMEIGYEQVGSMFRSLDINPTEEDVLKVLGNPSKEEMSSKKLKFEEFLPCYSQLLKDCVEGTFDDLLEGLRVFDKEGNGTVMGAEIRHVLRTLGDKMDASEISGVMDGQEDMNGSINIEGFCKYLIEGKKEEK